MPQETQGLIALATAVVVTLGTIVVALINRGKAKTKANGEKAGERRGNRRNDPNWLLERLLESEERCNKMDAELVQLRTIRDKADLERIAWDEERKSARHREEAWAKERTEYRREINRLTGELADVPDHLRNGNGNDTKGENT